MSTQLTLAQLNAAIAAYVDSMKISQAGFNPTFTSTAGLLDKIAKTFIIDGLFSDKLPELDGESLDYGKTLEEYYANLVMPQDDDREGASTLAPAPLTYMPPCYSYALPKKHIKDTKYNDDLEQSFTSPAAYVNAVDLIVKRLWDSYAQAKYTIKKQLLAALGDACYASMHGYNGVDKTQKNFAASTNYKVGTYLADKASATQFGVVVKEIPASQSPVLTWETAISGGYIVALDLVTSIAAPTDTQTGEDFIKQVKKYGKRSKFVTEGNSLNGACIGASTGLELLILSDLMPSVEVDTWAGAFNKDQALFDVEKKEIDDFAADTHGIFAMLIDKRGVRVHQDYLAVRTQENADGDFQNYVLHYRVTCAWSRSTFVHVFLKA